MAAGLGFKNFASGEVLTAADVNAYLNSQTVMVFADAAARTSAISSPQEGMFSYLKDTNTTQYYTGSAWTNLDTTGMVNPMTTTGDTIYSSSGTTPARLGIGTTGQVLTVAGGLPTWATPAAGGGGKVLQVVNATYSTQTSTTSTSYADTGLTANITPSATSSKILVLVNQVGCNRANGSANGNLELQLVRSGTSIIEFEKYFGYNANSVEINGGSCSTSYLDSPATAASVTYKTQQRIGGTTGTFATQANGGTSTITLIEIGA
jgi:hypothetical protein